MFGHACKGNYVLAETYDLLIGGLGDLSKIDSIAYQIYYSEGGAWLNSQTLSPKRVAISWQNLARAVDAVLL